MDKDTPVVPLAYHEICLARYARLVRRLLVGQIITIALSVAILAGIGTLLRQLP